MIYIDDKFHCHTTNPDNKYRGFNVPFFDDKCETFTNGFMYVPPGEICVLDDGVVLDVETVAPWKPFDELDNAQREYERALIADMQNALNKLGVTLDG